MTKFQSFVAKLVVNGKWAIEYNVFLGRGAIAISFSYLLLIFQINAPGTEEDTMPNL